MIGQVGASPFREAVLETACRAAAAAQETDGVVGEDAVRAAAVGDDLEVRGEVLDVAGELVDRDRAGAGDVPGCVLGLGAHVDHDDVTGGEPFGELVAADLFEPVAVAEVGGGELVEPFVVGGGHVAERRPQLADPGRRRAGSRSAFRRGES